jgi:TonB family protein
MRVMRRGLAVGCGISLVGTPAAAAPRQPTGPWHVEYDTAQCVAMRDYGTDAKPLEFVLKPSPRGGVMRILVLRKGSADVEQAPATLRFGERRLNTNLLQYSDEKNRVRVIAINVPMMELKAQLGTPSISIVGASLAETFVMTNLPALVAELDKCLLDLQKYWNVDEPYAAQIASSVKTTPPLKALFSPEDYPAIALNHNQQGSVTMTFLVDEKGAVADCSVDDSSGVPALDTMSCYVVKNRAKFEPARGSDGKPIRSAYTETVVWRIAP